MALGPSDPTDPGAIEIKMVTSLDVSDAAAYHSVAPTGQPYALVLANEATSAVDWQTAAAHEVFEAIIDPQCNDWAQDMSGRLWALEVCDPVQADWYPIDLGDGLQPVAISNWCTPAWFADRVHVNAAQDPLDKMGLATASWQIRPGGYAITISGGQVESLPAARPAAAVSRWTRRFENAVISAREDVGHGRAIAEACDKRDGSADDGNAAIDHA
jgi:hypothetical protein